MIQACVARNEGHFIRLHKTQEDDADKRGLVLAKKAGYDLRGAECGMARLEEVRKAGGGKEGPASDLLHDSSLTRIVALRKMREEMERP